MPPPPPDVVVHAHLVDYVDFGRLPLFCTKKANVKEGKSSKKMFVGGVVFTLIANQTHDE